MPGPAAVGGSAVESAISRRLRLRTLSAAFSLTSESKMQFRPSNYLAFGNRAGEGACPW
jgi:hypothetical protein